MAIKTDWLDFDVVVVGSGGAGAQAARAAAEAGARVLVVSKDPVGCSDTKISEGIATVRQSGADDDSEEVLSENLKMAGGDLPLQSVTDAFAKDSQSAYDEYRKQGLRPPIDTSRDTPQPLPLPMGGHTRRRSVGHANWNAILQGGRIEYLEDAWFLDLVAQRNKKKQIVGGVIYDASEGRLIAVRSPAVVIAAGGLSTLFFPKTDTMRGNTGDSYAIAARAGAELVDMEQLQFLPFCLASPPSYEGLLCGEPVTASFLGVLRDKDGKVILDGVYLRTRAECSSAIMRAVEAGKGSPNGGAYLDMTANKTPPRSGPYFMKFVESCLPTAYRNARQELGKAAASCDEPWEVRPSAHYSMGGIRTDANGASVAGEGDGDTASGIAGLFAAGQSMGGLFGANRLGSTSLTKVQFLDCGQGAAAAELARDSKVEIADETFEPIIAEASKRFGQKGSCAAAPMKLELQEASWECIGPVRTAERLAKIDRLIEEWTAKLESVSIPDFAVYNQAFIEFEELCNMLETAKLLSAAAKERDGSLGGHVRLDCGEISAFSQPYSTLCSRVKGGRISVSRVARDRTPFKRIVSYKLQENWRKAQIKILRLMPAGLQDKKLEERYVAIMGKSGTAPKIIPGGADGAVGEATKA